MYNRNKLSNPLLSPTTQEKLQLPNFSYYVNGSPAEKEEFLKKFKSNDYFSTILGLLKRVDPYKLYEYNENAFSCGEAFCYNHEDAEVPRVLTREHANYIYVNGAKLLKWITSSDCTIFSQEEKQAIIGFTAIIAIEPWSKIVSGTQSTNLRTCAAVPPILSVFKESFGIPYNNWFNHWGGGNDCELVTAKPVWPYLMGKSLATTLGNRNAMVAAIEELQQVDQKIGTDELVRLVTPPSNRVYYPKNLAIKAIDKELSVDTYNSLGYFERCMILGFWLFKYKHPLMIRDVTSFESLDMQEPMWLGDFAQEALGTNWMNLFNSVQLAKVEDLVAE